MSELQAHETQALTCDPKKWSYNNGKFRVFMKDTGLNHLTRGLLVFFPHNGVTIKFVMQESSMEHTRYLSTNHADEEPFTLDIYAG